MTHTSTLADPRVAAALERMFAEAERDDSRPFPRAGGTMTAQEQADAAAEIYMPISPEGGRLLYTLVRAARPATVVEFGTSFGISTLYLASAVRDNGTGRVVTTELSKEKIAAARRTFAETGLDDVITVLEGDARETLAGLSEPAGFVLLDGWKDLYLPVLRLLEPRLAPGTLVAADDTTFDSVRPYLDYVRDPANGYESVPFPVEDGIEISCRL
ncbi:O-methyltransferase [[Actinomadura] parvosata subsp. kistnae]|uniref:Methyltransferase n=1 Tax=[Actinomadura] parvosata subsp. kistnae TaxID=1909395 RepID=A0A1V0AHF8_9ACTN|nr:class I SAM-dependent methyltransferase [Nonomuraea sp. ATCC 55076]AQZ69635.1 methyltransferase [Nonomuraea sp. ATCC 55076]SPL91664.1 O-methyltransferase [Actinomadura parvosata subsp. kistnae]